MSNKILTKKEFEQESGRAWQAAMAAAEELDRLPCNAVGTVTGYCPPGCLYCDKLRELGLPPNG